MIGWLQLDHMEIICTSLQTDNHARKRIKHELADPGSCGTAAIIEVDRKIMVNNVTEISSLAK